MIICIFQNILEEPNRGFKPSDQFGSLELDKSGANVTVYCDSAQGVTTCTVGEVVEIGEIHKKVMIVKGSDAISTVDLHSVDNKRIHQIC